MPVNKPPYADSTDEKPDWPFFISLGLFLVVVACAVASIFYASANPSPEEVARQRRVFEVGAKCTRSGRDLNQCAELCGTIYGWDLTDPDRGRCKQGAALEIVR